MKADERALLLAVFAESETKPPHRKHARYIAAGLGIHHKRADYLFEKWTGNGWYDYGVCVDLGWLTAAGKEAALGVAK